MSAMILLKGTGVPPSVYCSCGEKPPVDIAYRSSDLVVKGRIVGNDTVTMLDGYYQAKKGIRIGRHRYRPAYSQYVRIKLVVEDNFKSPFPIADTLFIITPPDPAGCGAHFIPYLEHESIPREIYNYIIYGYKWEDHSLAEHTVGKKIRREIKRAVSSNTFVTSSCTRTRWVNPDELAQLNKIRR